MNPNIYTLEARLRTFEKWPNNILVSKIELASAGYIYTGIDDIVVCHLCDLTGANFTPGDDPMADHRDISPECPFFRTLENGPPGYTSSLEVLLNSIRQLGRNRRTGPHNENKTTIKSRISTFEDWPRSMKQRPADLARAGLYYTGVGDQTLCFHCGGGLRDWEESDDPWELHALRHGKCAYLKSKKGTDFIEKVRHKADPSLTLPGTSGDHTKKPAHPRYPLRNRVRNQI